MKKSILNQSMYSAFLICILALNTLAREKDPSIFFYSAGELIGDWRFRVGDSGDWNHDVENLNGLSKKKKVMLRPDSYMQERDAVRATWLPVKERGGFKLVAARKNFSEVKNQAALAFHMKIHSEITGNVELAIDCGYPCRGGVDLTEPLKKKRRGKWFVFPVPLNCISGETLDLSKVKAIMLASSGEMDISFHDISLIRMPEGSAGCAK